MRKICLLIPLLFTSVFSSWINKSELLINQKIPESVSEYAQCTANQEMVFELDNQKTTKWKIHTIQPLCTLSIVKGSTLVKSTIVKNGSFTFKQLLEPGTYKAISSADARISLYEWRVLKTKSIIPVGGGIVAPIVINNKKVSYYRAAPDTIPVFKIKGPTKTLIYIRADVTGMQKTSTIDVTITDKVDGKVISHKTASKYKSKKAVYTDDKTLIPGQALIITLDVPSGNHEYSVLLGGAHGAVRTKIEFHKKMVTAHTQRPIKW
jgi:hypothetical protein